MLNLDNATEIIESNLVSMCAASTLFMLLLNSIMPNALARVGKLFFNSMPVEKVFIPARLPHPNQYKEANDTDLGRTPPFEIILSSATKSRQIIVYFELCTNS